MLRHVLPALDLREKVKTTAVEIVFTINYAQVCSTSKRGHVIAGVKIVDRDTKNPWTDKSILRYDG